MLPLRVINNKARACASVRKNDNYRAPYVEICRYHDTKYVSSLFPRLRDKSPVRNEKGGEEGWKGPRVERFKWNSALRFTGTLDLAGGSTETKRMQPPGRGMHSFCTGHKASARDPGEEGARDSFAEVTALRGRVILSIQPPGILARTFSERIPEEARASLRRSGFAAAR